MYSWIQKSKIHIYTAVSRQKCCKIYLQRHCHLALLKLTKPRRHVAGHSVNSSHCAVVPLFKKRLQQWRRNECESRGEIQRKAPEKNFFGRTLHFLALKVQLVVLVSAFVMVSTVWSVSCLLFFYSRCPRAIWSRRHWSSATVYLSEVQRQTIPESPVYTSKVLQKCQSFWCL